MKASIRSILFSLLYCSSITLTALAQAQARQAPAKDAVSQCYDKIGNGSRGDIAPCLDELRKKARAELEAKVKALRKDIRDTGSSGSEAALKSLMASQYQFELFRKAECQRVGDAAMGGSGAGDFQAGCEVNLMNWRTRQLAN